MNAAVERIGISNGFRLSVFIGLLLYLSSTTSYVIKSLLEGSPIAILMAGYMRPFVLAAIVISAIFASSRIAGSIVRNRGLFALIFLFSLTFTVMDLIHVSGTIDPVRVAKEFFYNKTFSSYLNVPLLLLAVGLLVPRDCAELFVRAGGWTLAFSGTLSISIWLLIRFGVVTTGDHFWTNNNFQAYEGVGLLLMLAIFPQLRPRPWLLAMMTLMSVLLPILHNSRGAMFLSAYLCVAWAIQEWLRRKSGNAQDPPFMFGVLGLSVAVLAVGLGGIVQDLPNALSSATPLSSVGSGGAAQDLPNASSSATPFASVGSGGSAQDLPNASSPESPFSLVGLGGAAPKLQDAATTVSPTFSGASVEEDLGRIATKLVDIARSPSLSKQTNFISNKEVSTSDNVVSAFSRIGTTFVAVKIFLLQPWKGIGIWHAYDIEVAGFGIHGLVPLLMAAYGVWGLLPCFAIGMVAVVVGKRSGKTTALLHLAFTLLALGLLLNIFAWWLALVFAVGLFIEPETATS